jgi:secreted trypsin-like serine protease
MPTEKGEWPWLVAMYIKSTPLDLKFQCGGSVLSTNVVLTGNPKYYSYIRCNSQKN